MLSDLIERTVDHVAHGRLPDRLDLLGSPAANPLVGSLGLLQLGPCPPQRFGRRADVGSVLRAGFSGAWDLRGIARGWMASLALIESPWKLIPEPD